MLNLTRHSTTFDLMMEQTEGTIAATPFRENVFGEYFYPPPTQSLFTIEITFDTA